MSFQLLDSAGRLTGEFAAMITFSCIIAALFVFNVAKMFDNNRQ